jgi:serine protease Do
LTLENVTPQMARRLRLPSGRTGAVIADVDADGPSAGALRPGDVIVSVNRKTVSTAADAARELQRVESGHIAQLLVWRGDGEVFVTVKKD